MNRVISIAGKLVVLVLTFGLDVVAGFIRVDSVRTFDTWRGLWLFDIVELAFAVSIVAFGWLFLFKGAKSAMVSSVALIVGLLVLFSLQLRILFPNLSTEIFFGPLDRFAIVTPFTYLFHIAALFAVMGTAGLLRTITGLRAGTQSETIASNT